MAKMTLKLLMMFFLAQAAWCANYDGYLIISDFDDTLKITNTTNPAKMFANGFFKFKIFAGMGKLYSSMVVPGETLQLVSTSPPFMKPSIKKLLKKNRIVKSQLNLRNNPLVKSHKFKHQTLTRLFQEYPDKKIILIGDNSSEDHNVYADMASEYPGRVEQIYIRPVKDREALPGQFLYHSALDIAYNEMLAGRMDEQEVLAIARKVLFNNRDKEVYPSYLHCPKSFHKLTDDGSRIVEFYNTLQSRLGAICKSFK